MTSSTAPAAAVVADDSRATRAAWVGLIVLTGINLFNYLDRYIVPAVMESIRRSPLQPSDFQLGLLTTGFIVVYMLSAPPIGLLADRGSRPKLLGAGVAIWSVATALGGVARNYLSLLAARAAVGIGEAAYGTISPALLADYFPARYRGRVFAVFFVATPVGAALGYVIGGVVDKAFGWRAVFFVAGLPGLVLALLAFALRDPGRGVNDTPASDRAPEQPSPPAGGGTSESALIRVARHAIPATYLTLLRNRQYALTVLGYAAYTFAVGGISVWMPAFLERVRHVPNASEQLGVVLVGTGLAGTLAGGWIGDWLLPRTRQAYLWVSGVSAIVAAPLAWVALTSVGPVTYWVSLVAAELLIFASTGPINSAIVNAVSPAHRAAAMALSILAIHLLGDVPSPIMIGAISDRSSLASAVLIIPVAVLVSGAIWVFAARRGDRAGMVAMPVRAS